MCHRRAILALSYALLPVFFLLTLRFGFGLMILTNQTNSLPYLFFLYNSKATLPPLKRGDFIMFHHHASTLPIIKKVVGMEGDVISKTTDTVMIENCVLPIKTHDSTGHEMKAIKDDRVSDRCVFVSGSHHQSFDSRYEAFGLVPLSNVKGVVCPLF